MKSFVDSSPHVGDIKELANILDEYGYLYLKNFVPKEPLLTLQKEVLTLLKGAGWSDCDVWDKHTANMEAVCKPPEKNYRQVHDKLWSLEILPAVQVACNRSWPEGQMRPCRISAVMAFATEARHQRALLW